jgi:hypothetical protein
MREMHAFKSNYFAMCRHLVCVVGRVDASLAPAFTTTLSLHEIALGATHQFGYSGRACGFITSPLSL